jgi:hypothetical protein
MLAHRARAQEPEAAALLQQGQQLRARCAWLSQRA